LSIAKGSTGETRSQMYRGIDQNYFPAETVDLITEYADLASNIFGFIKYLNQSEIRGQKFKDRTT
jgi:four helix bundle protein